MHEHAHNHDAHAPIEDGREMTYYEKRTYAIQSLLVEKGVVTADEIRRAIEDMDARTPALSARVVVRAWVDPKFKARLLTDAQFSDR
jgi:nitrile hydratase